MDSDHEVVIVGGGLGGSAAAAFLAAHGVRSVVLERHTEPNARPRAWVMSARTLELFRTLGLDDAVRSAGSPGAWDLRVVESLLGAPIGGSVVDRTADVSPTGAAMCDQDVQEDLLRRYAVDHGAEFGWGREVVGVDPDRGIVRCADGPPLRARYVVLAAGARGRLLEPLGIEASVAAGSGSAEFDQVLFRSAELDRLMADRPGRAFVVTAADAIVFRRDLGRWQLQRQGGRVADVEHDLAAAVGRPIDADVLDHSTWTPGARRADRYRAGDVFVLGDAAHSMPPSLGMAGNLAVADAHNLAWKLAWVLGGRADARLLDSYEAERKPVDDFVLDQSLARMADRPVLNPLALQLGLGYPPGRSGALHGDGDDLVVSDPRALVPRVGIRLPHQRCPDGRSTLDRVRPDTFVAVGPGRHDLPIPYEQIRGVHADPERVWLVRPDGHVAACVAATEVAQTVRTLIGRR